MAALDELARAGGRERDAVLLRLDLLGDADPHGARDDSDRCVGSARLRGVEEGGAVYTSGLWNVKEGHEDDFARRWQASVDHLALEYPGITFRLLRDAGNPRRFVSVGGPWRGAEQIEAARELAARIERRWPSSTTSLE